MRDPPELVLGTAQLGMPYGVAGPDGGVEVQIARDILWHAWDCGVRSYDTAAGYGDSELRIGDGLGAAPGLRIITKLKALDPDSPLAAGEQVRASVEGSLQRLQRSAVDALLVHRIADLLGPQGEVVWRTLEALRGEGLIRRLGASVYRAEEIDALLERRSLELIQLPLNLLDQRLLASGHLDRLRERGVEIHLRSLFLQGLLLLEGRLPDYFLPLQAVLVRLRGDLARRGLKPLAAALGFARSLSQVSAVVIGVDSITQLDEILVQWQRQEASALDYAAYAVDDEDLLDPSRWPQREQLRAAAGG